MNHTPGFLAIVAEAKTRVTEITIEDFVALQATGTPITLVDVREDKEWEAGHAAAAIHLGKGVIERDVETSIPEQDALIVLYCGGGYRSALAADSLQKMGYRQVRSMAGGWRAWVAAGLPIEV